MGFECTLVASLLPELEPCAHLAWEEQKHLLYAVTQLYFTPIVFHHAVPALSHPPAHKNLQLGTSIFRSIFCCKNTAHFLHSFCSVCPFVKRVPEAVLKVTPEGLDSLAQFFVCFIVVDLRFLSQFLPCVKTCSQPSSVYRYKFFNRGMFSFLMVHIAINGL